VKTRRSTLDRTGISILAAVAIAAIGACTVDGPTSPDFPIGAVNYKPLPVYSRWWSQVEACSGLRGDFNHVLYYKIPGATGFNFRTLRNVPAMWMEDDRIVVAENSVRSGQIVRHQMLHSLMQQGHHKRDAYLQACAGLVDCAETCMADVGPEPAEPPNMVEVDPSELEVNISIWPENPGMDVLDGYVEVTVTAHNASNRAVRVKLPPPSATPGLGTTFRQNLMSQSTSFARSQSALSVEAMRFAPGETKRRVFGYWIGGTATQQPLESGKYQVLGAFAEKWALTPAPVMVRR